MPVIDEVYRAAIAHAGAPGPTSPVPAVAVVLWRTAASTASAEPIEVFLVERAPTLSFLPGYWCFPGGRIDPADGGPIAAAFVLTLVKTILILKGVDQNWAQVIQGTLIVLVVMIGGLALRGRGRA